MTPGEINVSRGYATVIRVRAARGELIALEDLRWLAAHEQRETKKD